MDRMNNLGNVTKKYLQLNPVNATSNGEFSFRNGLPLIKTIGFGIVLVYSDSLVPSPPANITTFIIFFYCLKFFHTFQFVL